MNTSSSVLDPVLAGRGDAPARTSRRRSSDGASTPTPAANGSPSDTQKEVNTAHAWQRGPGRRINAELKNWRVLRTIRSSPSDATDLAKAVQALMIANA